MKKTKELKKMSRAELLDLLLEAMKENETMKGQIQTLSERLSSREVLISNAGSIAEAALTLSGVFDAAQEAAETYLVSLQKASEAAEQILQSAKKEAEQIKKEAERQSAAMLDSAKRRAAEIRAGSEKDIGNL